MTIVVNLLLPFWKGSWGKKLDLYICHVVGGRGSVASVLCCNWNGLMLYGVVRYSHFHKNNSLVVPS